MDKLTYFDDLARELIDQAGASSDLDEKTAVTMRVIAAKLQKEAGVTHKAAVDFNPLLTKAMRIGYHMALNNRSTTNLDTFTVPEGFAYSGRAIKAA